MAIELLQPKQDELRAVEIRKRVLVQGQVLNAGSRVKIPLADAYDLVHAGQARFLTAEDMKEKK